MKKILLAGFLVFIQINTFAVGWLGFNFGESENTILKKLKELGCEKNTSRSECKGFSPTPHLRISNIGFSFHDGKVYQMSFCLDMCEEKFKKFRAEAEKYYGKRNIDVDFFGNFECIKMTLTEMDKYNFENKPIINTTFKQRDKN